MPHYTCFCFFFRYIESMVHFASIRHPATILDDLHGKVLNEAYQISKSTVTDSVSKEWQMQERFGSVRALELLNRVAIRNIQTHFQDAGLFIALCVCEVQFKLPSSNPNKDFQS